MKGNDSLTVPLRILQFGSSSSWNGEAAHVASLCRSLSALGHEVILAYRTVRKGKRVTIWEERLGELDVSHSIPISMDSGFYPVSLTADLRALRSCLRSDPPPDVVHAHRSQDHWLAAAALLMSSRKPILVRTRHVTTHWRPHLLNRWHYQHTDLVLATCSRINDVMEQTDVLPASRRAVFHGGVDVSRFDPRISGARIRDELGIGPEDPVVTAVGHLDPVKGYATFIRSLKEIQSAIPSIRGLVVGRQGKVRMSDLRDLGGELGLTRNLFLLGERRDVPEIMAATDVGVVPSLGSEGNSRVTLEFMAMRVPLVVTDVGALSDLVTDNETGRVVEPGNIKHLSRRVIQILNDPDMGAEYAARAYKRLRSEYTEQTVAKNLVELYRRSMAARTEPRE